MMGMLHRKYRKQNRIWCLATGGVFLLTLKIWQLVGPQDLFEPQQGKPLGQLLEVKHLDHSEWLLNKNERAPIASRSVYQYDTGQGK